jgi:hypothetical protein
MTQTEAKQQLTILFTEFLKETNLEKLKSIKAQIVKFYSAIPFSDSFGQKMELVTLDNDMNIYFNNILDISAKSILAGDFDRILISVSVSLLKD